MSDDITNLLNQANQSIADAFNLIMAAETYTRRGALSEAEMTVDLTTSQAELKVLSERLSTLLEATHSIRYNILLGLSISTAKQLSGMRQQGPDPQEVKRLLEAADSLTSKITSFQGLDKS